MQWPIDPTGLASLAAVIGLVGRAAGPLFPTRTSVLGVQLAIGLAFATHYALIGIAAAAIVNVLGLLQTAAALLPLSVRTVRHASWGLLAAMAVAIIASWAGPASLLVIAGQTFIVIGRMQQDATRVFALLLVGQLLWGAHDIVVGCPVAVAADAVGLLVGGWMLGRHGTPAGHLRSFTLWALRATLHQRGCAGLFMSGAAA